MSPSCAHGGVHRRRFLKFLAASPLLVDGAVHAPAQELAPASPAGTPSALAPDAAALLTDPSRALDVFEFEPVMKRNVPPAHFGYMATGLDDEATLRRNREGFLRFQLRPRRLIDVSTIDMRCEIFGLTYDSPIVIAPTGSNRAFHPDGDVDAIIVSNHGGRAEDGGGSTIEALPEIIDAVAGRIPVLVDSGFRRGSDIVKALAIGARAVCIGRPYLWGLGAFGQAGVERVLEILRAEVRASLQQLGAPSLERLSPALVRRL